MHTPVAAIGFAPARQDRRLREARRHVEQQRSGRGLLKAMRQDAGWARSLYGLPRSISYCSMAAMGKARWILPERVGDDGIRKVKTLAAVSDPLRVT